MFRTVISAVSVLAAIGTLSMSGAANATPITVTFNPGVAVAGASQFTADRLNVLEYARADLGATSGVSTAFTESGFLQFNNASLNNNTFDPSGNRTAYSLYLAFNESGTQSAPNFNGSSTGVVSSLTYTLYEAAGASVFGIDGSNSPYVTNGGATALASGSLISGTLSFSASPLGAGANLDATLAQQLAGFVVSPNAALTLDVALNADANVITVLNGGTSFTLNGGGGDLAFSATPAAVPEPATLPLFVSGLGVLGLVGLLRKKRSAEAGCV